MAQPQTPAGFSSSIYCIALSVLLALAGCAKVEPLEAKIARTTRRRFLRWKRDVIADFPPAMQQRFEAVLQELRIDIQFKREVSGRDAIEAEVCKRLDHHSVKEALLMGLELKMAPLAAERGDLQRVIDANARLITKPGDRGRGRRSRGVSRQTSGPARRGDPGIAGVGKRNRRARWQAAGDDALAPTSQRAQCRATMPSSRSPNCSRVAAAPASMHYGPWPVRIDWTGEKLDEAKRAEFMAKVKAAVPTQSRHPDPDQESLAAVRGTRSSAGAARGRESRLTPA